MSFHYSDRELDPAKPETCPAIYAVADGIITRVDEAFRLRSVFFPERGGWASNVRYGLDLAFARKSGEPVIFHYSIEPMVDPGHPSFYRPFIKVAAGQHVRRGEVIARMFLPDDRKAAANAHIHFNLIAPGGQFQAPTIFQADLADRFRATWESRLAGGDERLPACFGVGLDDKEDPFKPEPDSIFTIPPIDPDVCAEIIPLGNLNPVGGHVLPIDHIYLNYDERVHLTGFVNSARYPRSTIQTVSPLALFAEPLRTQLYRKATRQGSDKDGRIDWDGPGRLLGNWFHESLDVADSSRGDARVRARQLAFVYDVQNPQAQRLSVGGTVAPVGLYEIQPGAPDPIEVTRASGAVSYRVRKLERAPGKAGDADSGVFLVELISDHELRIEYFEGGAAQTRAFGANATRYRR